MTCHPSDVVAIATKVCYEGQLTLLRTSRPDRLLSAP